MRKGRKYTKRRLGLVNIKKLFSFFQRLQDGGQRQHERRDQASPQGLRNSSGMT